MFKLLLGLTFSVLVRTDVSLSAKVSDLKWNFKCDTDAVRSGSIGVHQIAWIQTAKSFSG